MSFRVFFALSTGLSKPITATPGTKKEILERVALTEKELGLETEQYGSNPKHWKSIGAGPIQPREGVSDETFCAVAEEHNHYVRWLYERFSHWSESPVENGEVITPEESTIFWHGLKEIVVPPSRWTAEYYQARMEANYEALRGRESEGILFEEKPLTPRQAAAVISLFASYLDTHDLRLDVPKDCDRLASLTDGGCEWCEKCGAVTYEHVENCRKKKCPARDALGLEEDEE